MLSTLTAVNGIIYSLKRSLFQHLHDICHMAVQKVPSFYSGIFNMYLTDEELSGG